MTTRSYIILAVVVATGLAGIAFYDAEMTQWEITQGPTINVQEAKQVGIFAANLRFSPTEIDLGDTRYRIEEIWVQHRTEARRVHPFKTARVILPDLILCVRTKVVHRDPKFAKTELSIKNAVNSRIHLSGKNNVLFTEISESIPTTVTLTSKARDREEVVTLVRE